MSTDRRENVVLTPAEVDQLRVLLMDLYGTLKDLCRGYGIDADGYPTDAPKMFEELGEYMYPSDSNPVLPTCGDKLEAWLDAGPPEPVTVDANAWLSRRRLEAPLEDT